MSPRHPESQPVILSVSEGSFLQPRHPEQGEGSFPD